MAAKFVTIATFWEPWEAHLARDMLLDAGVNCFLSGENFVATYWLLAGADRGIKLKVAGQDAPKAVKILKADKNEAIKETADSGSDGQEETEVCPKCRSTNIEYERFSRKVFFLSILLLKFPLPFPCVRYKCRSCGYTWR
ncbi:MAG TPA: hypothetical protein HPP87_07615 [Planctomycetes bacterium]|nr:hypothetical protein [Planctomycetota bacterium]